MAQTMRAIAIHNETGPPSSLHISSTIPRPTPKPGECLIRVAAFGLNRADTLQREGRYPVPAGASTILGLEFAGTVEEVGPPLGATSTETEAGSAAGAEKDQEEEEDETRTWRKGDEVFGLAYGGCYAAYVSVSARMLIRKPATISYEDAAALPEVWFTALQAMYLVGGFEAEAGRTKSVLWHAGGSGVSIAGQQLCRLAASKAQQGHGGGAAGAGVKWFATARKDGKCTFCTSELGCTAAINTTQPDWVPQLLAANDGHGFDLIVDYVGAPYFASNLALAALDGRIVMLGFLGGAALAGETDISAVLRKRLRIEGSTLRSRDEVYQGRLRRLFEREVLPGVVSGVLKGHVDRVLSWRDVGRGHECLEGNENTGKIVCRVD
ncbi:MAG: hypothetical protein M1828_003015 [Chrysothrix sp. TS-e1954]|nr:MAG: hypothetical protein M1828_003015 [Chrysothrix sp. TS-e1954]